jgi:hypothetical protein
MSVGGNGVSWISSPQSVSNGVICPIRAFNGWMDMRSYACEYLAISYVIYIDNSTYSLHNNLSASGLFFAITICEYKLKTSSI